MSAARHTPGPWELARNDQHAGSIATLYGGQSGYIEVWTTKWPDGVNQEANARLIAASPDLLTTLTQLCFVIRTGGDVLKACEGAEALIGRTMGGAS